MPKSQIDLFVTVLESDGWDGDLSMCVATLGSPIRGADCQSAEASRRRPLLSPKLESACAELSQAALRCARSVQLGENSADDVFLQAILPSTSTAVLDPTRDEVQKAASFVTLACMPALGTVTNLRVNGVVASDALAEVSRSRHSFTFLLATDLSEHRRWLARTRSAVFCTVWRGRHYLQLAKRQIEERQCCNWPFSPHLST